MSLPRYCQCGCGRPLKRNKRWATKQCQASGQESYVYGPEPTPISLKHRPGSRAWVDPDPEPDDVPIDLPNPPRRRLSAAERKALRAKRADARIKQAEERDAKRLERRRRESAHYARQAV